MNEFQKQSDETKKSYNTTVDEYVANVDSRHPYWISDKFTSRLERGASILDVGCGPGRDAKIFSDMGYEVHGIDFASNMIDKARSRVKSATFEVMDITQLSLDNKYDAFWASASLLHVPHDKLLDVLKDLKSLLKPNGIGMFSLKLRLSDVDLETFVPDSRYGGVNKFWAYYTEAEIRRFLTEAGLELLEFAYKDNTASEYVTHEWMYCFVKNS